MQANDNEPEYVDDRGLAKRTPIARVAWQKWRALGKGPPYYKVGKRCLYRWDEVQAWMETLKVKPKKAS